MPASSVGALNAWGVYLIASAALILVLSPMLTGAARDSREGADWRTADGVRAVLDSLRPGITLDMSFGVSSSADPLRLRGHLISCDYGGGTISLPTRWALPDVTLSPLVNYAVRVSGGEVLVVRSG